MKDALSEQISLIEELRGNVYVGQDSTASEAVLGVRGEGHTLSSFHRDFTRRLLPLSRQITYRRLRHLQRILDDEHVKKHCQVIMTLRRVAESLRINAQARERAINIYLRAAKRLARTDKKELITLAAASILLAVRELGHTAPVTLQEIVDGFNGNGARIKPMRVVEEAKNIERALGERVRIRDCRDYLWRLVSDITRSPDIEKRLAALNVDIGTYRHKLFITALKLLKIAENRRGGRRPYIVAATALYAADRFLAFKEGHRPFLTQRLIAKRAGVSECTIREHYNAIFRELVIRMTVLSLISSSS